MPKKLNRPDGRGTVLVTLTLLNAQGERVKGNTVETFKVSATTVRTVAAALVAKVFKQSGEVSLK